jgi:HlyD family secretion protein
MRADVPKAGNGHVVNLLEGERPPGRPADEIPAAAPPARRWRRAGTAALLLAAAAGVAALVAWHLLKTPPAPGIVEASGRIEGRITTVTPKSFGRVVAIRVDEGQRVRAGQVLAVLDDEAQRQRIRAAEENLRALQERLRSVETQLAVSTQQVPLQIAQAEDGLRQAEASLGEARANATQTARDAERSAQLLGRELIAPQEAEAAALKASVAREAVNEAQAGLARAQKQLALTELGTRQLEAQRADRDSLVRQVRQAEAALAEQASYLADFTIRSPLDGTVLTRNIELGMRMNVGDTLYSLVDLNQLYLKVYVPEPQIGKVALGQEARVYVDAYPGRPFAARVSKIYQQAEFTPKNVETKEERVKLVFPVELALVENPGGVLKPGMPADGLIRAQADAPWPEPTPTMLRRFLQGAPARPSGMDAQR